MQHRIRTLVSSGRLFYVVGASGVGKDTLIRYAREALEGSDAVVFAHRYITRPAESGGENHIALTMAEFMLRERHGLFAMTWESHGYRYGVGIEIDRWLAAGLTVVVNGSRAYIAQATERYPEVKVVWVTAQPHVIAKRLAQRGRESTQAIAARLRRNSRLPIEAPRGALHIPNDGSLESAGNRFLSLLAAETSLI